jgi:hypothetical protein
MSIHHSTNLSVTLFIGQNPIPEKKNFSVEGYLTLDLLLQYYGLQPQVEKRKLYFYNQTKKKGEEIDAKNIKLLKRDCIAFYLTKEEHERGTPYYLLQRGPLTVSAVFQFFRFLR